MNVLIIEDELKTARALEKLITGIKPGVRVLASLQSIKASVDFLATNPAPDLIFMDIQLSDGISFEIFKETKVTSPVVFCTAYDEYAIQAFKANGIDYILKPFSKETITEAFNKAEMLSNFFQLNENAGKGIETLLQQQQVLNGKKSFLVFKNNKYQPVPTASIAYFYIRNEIAHLVTFDGAEFALTMPLDEIQRLLNPEDYYRLNRQYLVGFAAVKEVEHYFSRKLLLKLTLPTAEDLIVGKDKSTSFFNWLNNR